LLFFKNLFINAHDSLFSRTRLSAFCHVDNIKEFFHLISFVLIRCQQRKGTASVFNKVAITGGIKMDFINPYNRSILRRNA